MSLLLGGLQVSMLAQFYFFVDSRISNDKTSQPSHSFPRSFLSVQGVVYTKSCKYAGVDTLLDATPTLGAIVKLKCNNTIHPMIQDGQSDKNGYFYMEAPKSVTSFGAHKCKVFLYSAPNKDLNPSNLNGGVTGSPLKPEKSLVSQNHKLPFLLYSVGPFAFEPKCSH
ncbi:hypothetical protein RJT34_13696 [Clitoria ternatea]|uniref:Uncharacterized protein n=1 Tax=Clitoria ternatea TaxID=43366 RepID=A0AAN9JP14_CLITE